MSLKQGWGWEGNSSLAVRMRSAVSSRSALGLGPGGSLRLGLKLLKGGQKAWFVLLKFKAPRLLQSGTEPKPPKNGRWGAGITLLPFHTWRTGFQLEEPLPESTPFSSNHLLQVPLVTRDS